MNGHRRIEGSTPRQEPGSSSARTTNSERVPGPSLQRPSIDNRYSGSQTTITLTWSMRLRFSARSSRMTSRACPKRTATTMNQATHAARGTASEAAQAAIGRATRQSRNSPRGRRSARKMRRGWYLAHTVHRRRHNCNRRCATTGKRITTDQRETAGEAEERGAGGRSRSRNSPQRHRSDKASAHSHVSSGSSVIVEATEPALATRS
jgi:hypothetical protein